MDKTSDQSLESNKSAGSQNFERRFEKNFRRKKIGQNTIWNMVQSILAAAFVLATLFTLWTPANVFSNQLLADMWITMQADEAIEPEESLPFPTPTDTTIPPIGIVAGHYQNDSGAVCPDGLTEVALNLEIATLVRQNLINEGYNVDLLAEFDEKLFGYEALALISIHNDSCEWINNDATGFKVSQAISTTHPEKVNRLSACLIHYYGETTQLPFHQHTITNDMTDYHAFDEIDDKTPAVIIEAGFMNLDYQILTENTELVAQGITSGILCYIRNEPLPEKSNEITP